jgi:hypothetical protein
LAPPRARTAWLFPIGSPIPEADHYNPTGGGDPVGIALDPQYAPISERHNRPMHARPGASEMLGHFSEGPETVPDRPLTRPDQRFDLRLDIE